MTGAVASLYSWFMTAKLLLRLFTFGCIWLRTHYGPTHVVCGRLPYAKVTLRKDISLGHEAPSVS